MSFDPSPTYAREILTSEFGSGLDGLLRTRRERLFGILNGADRDVWNPATDPHLPVRFGKGGIGGKCRCKTTLQEELQLARDPEAPLLIHVSRLTEQKMSDVLLDALPAILDRGAQFALLGQGDPALERRFVEFARTHHDRMAVRIGYEEPLAHRLHAGADVLLHPSRFEPCGLTQIYAMRYGTLPIVRSIGGLADTVTDATAQAIRAGTATGFAFAGTSAADLIACIDRCLSLFRQPLAWRKIQRRAMEHDFGWENSARMYLELYRELAPNAAAASDPRADEDRQASAVPKVIGARR